MEVENLVIRPVGKLLRLPAHGIAINAKSARPSRSRR